MPVHTKRSLVALARRCGMQTSYIDASGQRQHSSPESIRAVLETLGVHVDDASAEELLAERERDWWQRAVDPVVVVWLGRRSRLSLRLPSTTRRVQLHIQLEDGAAASFDADWQNLETVRTERIDRESYSVREVDMPRRLPPGYHTLHVEAGGESYSALLIASPVRAYELGRGKWGGFMPLYALRTSQTLANADLSDLEHLCDWIGEQGGDVVGTLPLLASFLDKPFEPSPYAPASRLFWNEIYVDPRRAPELARCDTARHLLAASAFAGEAAKLRDARVLDYAAAMKLKRPVLEALAKCAAENPTPEFDEFRRTEPRLDEYAKFRAATEQFAKPWSEWPASARNGRLTTRDYDQNVKHYHEYVQWLAHMQLDALQQRANAPLLYLDLPVGVNRDGFNVWTEQELFVLGASAGAPPDPMFTKGQNWGFAPLHPQRLRDSGYQYFRESLQNLMTNCGVLRLDHVMGLQRLYWVPAGHEATDGAYVEYPRDELFAVLTLESHRHACAVIGEDLGTVPREIRTAMDRHGVLRMHVVQFVVSPQQPPYETPPANSVTSLNTHDMPTFTAFWEALDVADRIELGLLDDRGAQESRRARQQIQREVVRHLKGERKLRKITSDTKAALFAILLELAESDAQLLLINLEDLWLEEEPQNVPGTWRERPNWQRRARHTLEEIRDMDEIESLLWAIDRARKAKQS